MEGSYRKIFNKTFLNEKFFCNLIDVAGKKRREEVFKGLVSINLKVMKQAIE
jgi:hypothetical protein